MSLRYLVTGGAGFIGSALVKRLVEQGHFVRVVDSNIRGRARRLESVTNQIEFVEADIRDAVAVERVIENIDVVCHLAYINGTEYFYSQPELVLDVAIRGMLNVIDGCKKQGCKDLIIASSSEVYQTPPEVPTSEQVPLMVPDVSNPRFSYGGGKILWELMAMNYGRDWFNRVVVFRPHNVYGPDMGWEHVIPDLAVKAARELLQSETDQPLNLEILGDGQQTRAFVHINDFIDGLMLVINKGVDREIYHIGKDEEISISELANLVVESLGRDARISTSSAPEGETNRRCPNISKLRALGYNPAINLSQGLPSVVRWYNDNLHILNSGK